MEINRRKFMKGLFALPIVSALGKFIPDAKVDDTLWVDTTSGQTTITLPSTHNQGSIRFWEPKDNHFHHYAYTWNGNDIRAYIDGKETTKFTHNIRTQRHENTFGFC